MFIWWHSNAHKSKIKVFHSNVETLLDHTAKIEGVTSEKQDHLGFVLISRVNLFSSQNVNDISIYKQKCCI